MSYYLICQYVWEAIETLKTLKVLVVWTWAAIIDLIIFELPILAATPITPHGTARFQSNTATIDTAQSPARYRSIWLNAIQTWNRTGAFTFQPDNANDAQVTVKVSPSLGNAYTGMTYLTIDNQGYIDKVECDINNVTLRNFHYTRSEWVNVAEHELGHAIGLNHNPAKASVMYAANRVYSIQNVDVQSVKALYSEQPDRVSAGGHTVQFYDPTLNVQTQQTVRHFPAIGQVTNYHVVIPNHCPSLVAHVCDVNQVLLKLIGS